jgi:hypothetical protein
MAVNRTLRVQRRSNVRHEQAPVRPATFDAMLQRIVMQQQLHPGTLSA